MSAEELVLRPATELSALLTSGELSPVELTQAFIARAKRYDRLNAYITLDEEGALRQAQIAQAEIKRGAVRGPLHGLPIGVKDQFDVKGLRTTAGSVIVDYVADEDATAVARLREAGAVILGKLNLSEFALGGNVTHPHGIPHNPWDETRQAGQSSSGSGIAVAASLCAAASRSSCGRPLHTTARSFPETPLPATRSRSGTRPPRSPTWASSASGAC